MGQFIYGSVPATVEVDDRALAHLKIVIIAKLRRGEGFALSWDEPQKTKAERGRNTIWLHPGIPMQFKFFGSRQPSLNKLWLEDLMDSANSSSGLHLVPERAGGAENDVPPIY
jgi:hypothetical protein